MNYVEIWDIFAFINKMKIVGRYTSKGFEVIRVIFEKPVQVDLNILCREWKRYY